MKINDAIQEFLNLSKLNKKPGSFAYDKSKIMHFKKWLDANKGFLTIDQITKETIIDYLFHLKKTCVSNTVNKHLKVIKLFYSTLNINFEDLYQLKNLKERVKSFDMIDFNLLKPMTHYVLNLNSNIGNNLLYKGIYCLLIDTGARIGEILNIEKRNIDFNNNRILLKQTKNSEERYVYFTNELSGLIIKEIMARKVNSKYLLHNYITDQRANYGQAKYFINNELRNRFNLRKLHPHMFRHTVATYWIEHGADVLFVQKILGHKNIKTTTIYVHASDEHRKKIYDKVSFKSK